MTAFSDVETCSHQGLQVSPCQPNATLSGFTPRARRLLDESWGAFTWGGGLRERKVRLVVDVDLFVEATALAQKVPDALDDAVEQSVVFSCRLVELAQARARVGAFVIADDDTVRHENVR